MPDRRFFESLGPLGAGAICQGLNGQLLDQRHISRLIEGVSTPLAAGPSDLCFITSTKPEVDFAALQAGLVFVRPELVALLTESFSARAGLATAIFSCPDPRGSFAAAASRLWRVRPLCSEVGQHLAGQTVFIAPSAWVDPSAVIGEGTRIMPGAVIGPGVQIGRNCEIGVGAVIECSLIGDRVRIGPYCVIGKSGFGVVAAGQSLNLMPHLGRVILQDGVGLGGHVCVDRGVLDDTFIGESTQIDNFCQIAHNCRVGRNVVMAAFGGISGSTTIGDGAQLGGRVGVSDHGEIQAGARLAAGSLVMHLVPKGETWGGYPAGPIKKWMREVAWLRRSVHRRGGNSE